MAQEQKKMVYGRRAGDNTRNELSFFKLLSLVLSGVVCFMLFGYFSRAYDEMRKPKELQHSTQIPHYDKVKRIIAPLIYSGFKTLQRPNVNISIDFPKRAWRIHNFHNFDKEGNIVLENGRYGLCGQLSDYTYNQIKNIFGKEYDIEFVRASQMGYFLDPRSSHYVLRITHIKTGQRYIIDPTFNRYGAIQNFDDYLLFTSSDRLDFIERKEPDAEMPIGYGIPVMITKGFIMELVVDESAGYLDPNNFTLVLSCAQQYKFSGRRIYSLRMNEGKKEIFENKEMVEWLLNPEEYRLLLGKMDSWFQSLAGQLPQENQKV